VHEHGPVAVTKGCGSVVLRRQRWVMAEVIFPCRAPSYPIV